MVVIMFIFGKTPEGRRHSEMRPAKPLSPKHPMDTASALLGKNVEAPNGEVVGSIYDLVIDAHSGRIMFVLVATGGFAGLGTKLKAVPPSALSQVTAKRDTVALNLDFHRWAKAPTVNKSRLDELNDPAHEQAIYQYYQQVHLPPTGHTDGNAALTGSSNDTTKVELRLARNLIGQSVVNKHNQELGRVSDLTVDLSHPFSTRAIFKPLSTNGSVALPMSAFTINGAGGSLLLNSVREQSDDALWARVDISSGSHAFCVRQI